MLLESTVNIFDVLCYALVKATNEKNGILYNDKSNRINNLRNQHILTSTNPDILEPPYDQTETHHHKAEHHDHHQQQEYQYQIEEQNQSYVEHSSQQGKRQHNLKSLYLSNII